MKIAYLVSQYPAVSHTFILREIFGLRNAGINPLIFSVNQPDRTTEKLSEDEVFEKRHTYYIKSNLLLDSVKKVIPLGLSRPIRFIKTFIYTLKLAVFDLKHFFHFFAYFLEACVVVSKMESQSIRHIHVHFGNPGSTVVLLAKKLGGISYSITIHGPTSFANVDKLLIPLKLKEAKFVIPISYFARSQCMIYLPFSDWPKLKLVRQPGVDTTVYRPVQKNPKSTFDLLCVGRMVSKKGQFMLIQAMQELIKRHAHLRCRFIGSGPDLTALQHYTQQQGLSEYIVFEGSVNQREVKHFYEQSDLFVLPTFLEGLPAVLQEAMALGLPCVTTDVMGIPELIIDNETGVLVYPSHLDSLISGIEKFITDKAFYQKIVKQARKKVVEMYDTTTNVNHLISVFKENILEGNSHL